MRMVSAESGSVEFESSQQPFLSVFFYLVCRKDEDVGKRVRKWRKTKIRHSSLRKLFSAMADTISETRSSEAIPRKQRSLSIQ